MDAQAGLRLCCSQTPEDRFSRVEAHMIHIKYKGFLKRQLIMKSIEAKIIC